MSIEIDRLQLELAAATVPARAFLLERRMRDAVVRGLPRALETVDRNGDELVFIDRLVLEAHANSARDDDIIASAVARALLAALDRSLTDHASSVTRYSDRSEWIAAFVVALLDGRAWTDWRFDEFDGLRPLPLSAALRTLLINEAEHGVDALLRLAPAERLRTLRALTKRDLAKTAAVWSAQSGSRVRDVARLFDAATTFDGRLAELVDAALELQWEETGTLANALVLLVALTDVWAARAAWPQPCPAGSPRERLQSLVAAAALGAQLFAPLDDDQVTALLAAIDRACARGGNVSTVPESEAVALSTQHGGAFVLLAVLNWLGAPTQWQRALRAAVPEDAAAALVRSLALLTVAYAMRPRKPSVVFADRTLQRALAVTDPIDALQTHCRAVLSALAATAPAAKVSGSRASDDGGPNEGLRAVRQLSAQLLARLRERVPGCAQATGAYLRRNLLSQSAVIACRAAGLSVRCSRAPLHVLLLIAGLSTCRFELAGLAIEVASESAE